MREGGGDVLPGETVEDGDKKTDVRHPLKEYRSLTLCEIVVKFLLYLIEIPSVPN